MKNLAFTLSFREIAEQAGFDPEGHGKFNLPATQEAADKLAKAAADIVGEWQPGDPRYEVVLTGAAPIWAYLAIGHALHGRAIKLTYASPNATIIVFGHGA